MKVGKIRLHEKVYLILEDDPKILSSLKALGYLDGNITNLPILDVNQRLVGPEPILDLDTFDEEELQHYDIFHDGKGNKEEEEETQQPDPATSDSRVIVEEAEEQQPLRSFLAYFGPFRRLNSE